MTLNLWNDDFLRFERAHLAVEEIARLQPHLVALQEISVPHDMSTWIVNRVNEWTFGDEYFAFSWNKIGPQGAFEGLAILSRLSTVGPSEAIDLRGGGRIAQRITVDLQNIKIAFCNVHLHHPRGLDTLRVSQARVVSDWMCSLSNCILLLAGDFNSSPESAAMTLLSENWSSAYADYRGKEPDCTFPTPAIESKEEWFQPRVTDYILFQPSSLVVTNAELCFTKPGNSTEKLYPSDHYGLIVDFALKSKGSSRA